MWLISAVSVLATAQVSEPLQIGSVTHRIHGSGGVFSPSMSEHFQAYFKKRGFQIESTANYKGYRIWLGVVDQRLIIKNLYFEAYPDAKTEDIIGTSIPKEGLHADWFSGELIEFFGERFLAHTMSHERVFVFEQGRFVKTFERKNAWWEKWEQRSKKKG